MAIFAAKGFYTASATTGQQPEPPLLGGSSVPKVTALPASNPQQRGWYQVGLGPGWRAWLLGEEPFSRAATACRRRPPPRPPPPALPPPPLHSLCPLARPSPRVPLSCTHLLPLSQVNAGQSIDLITCFSGYQRRSTWGTLDQDDTMVRCAVLCCAALRCAVLCCAVLCCAGALDLQV